ncbi:MAG: rhomboid family intramembrane serine protease [Bacilli bacterium]|nr:rhomboid family intramembrane serine protease [Bacilli bacterium]
MKKVKSQDILSMKLMHYFICNKNYKPIIVNGVENEIWLENDNENYRIIRIVLNKIINMEQYELDLLKIDNILSQVKRKTLSISIKVLTFYLNMDEDLVIETDEESKEESKYKYIRVYKEKDIYDNEDIKKYYSDIESNMTYEEKDLELFVKLVSEVSDNNFKESEKSAKMFKNKNDKLLTFILIGINVTLFIIMCILGHASFPLLRLSDSILKNFGANAGILVKGGDYYRLIASTFLHVDIIHLLCNMYSLFVLGPTVDYFYGKLKFILIYLYSAITASLVALIFHGDNVFIVGASGAIFGLLGALLYFGYTYRGYIGNKMIGSLLSVIVINLAIGFAIPGISNYAHLGGLIGGLAISYMLGAGVENKKSSRISGAVILALLTGFLVFMAFFR